MAIYPSRFDKDSMYTILVSYTYNNLLSKARPCCRKREFQILSPYCQSYLSTVFASKAETRRQACCAQSVMMLEGTEFLSTYPKLQMADYLLSAQVVPILCHLPSSDTGQTGHGPAEASQLHRCKLRQSSRWSLQMLYNTRVVPFDTDIG